MTVGTGVAQEGLRKAWRRNAEKVTRKNFLVSWDGEDDETESDCDSY